MLPPGHSSMWAQPSETLDPFLFEGNRLRPEHREELMHRYYSTMSNNYANPQDWSHVWMAGSGASYHWGNKDLDMLVGVDYPSFRYNNSHMSGLTDSEISWVLNHYMRAHLSDEMKDWNGYETTWYNNPTRDITKLNPYAAYSLTDDTWHVTPARSVEVPPYNPDAEGDLTKAQEYVRRYSRAKTALDQQWQGPHAHAASMGSVVAQGAALYDEIHNNRRKAFLPGGGGYLDTNNVRWQAAKQSGAYEALKMFKDLHDQAIGENQMAQYGMKFPDPKELRIMAMLERR